MLGFLKVIVTRVNDSNNIFLHCTERRRKYVFFPNRNLFDVIIVGEFVHPKPGYGDRESRLDLLKSERQNWILSVNM